MSMMYLFIPVGCLIKHEHLILVFLILRGYGLEWTMLKILRQTEILFYSFQIIISNSILIIPRDQ